MMHASTLPGILILDDEFAQMKALCDTLKPEGYDTAGFTSPRSALEHLRTHEYDLVLTDLMMPEMDGVEFLRAAQELDPHLVGIIMTGHGTVNTAVKAMQTGALDYILKPFTLSAVLPVLSRALEVRRLRRENIQLQQAVGIYELSMALTASLDPEILLRKVGDAAARGPVHDVLILLPTPDGRSLIVALGCGAAGREFQGRLFPLDEALSQWLANVQEQFPNTDESAMSQAPHALAAPLPGAPGSLSIPMLAGGRLLGLLHLNFAQPAPKIAPGQIKALNVLASTAAAALDSALLLARLRSAEQQYRRLAENAPDIVSCFELEPQRRFAYISPAAAAITGYAPEEFYADPELAVMIVHPDDRGMMDTVLRGGYPSGSTVTLRWTHRNGKTIWIEQRNILVQDADGRLTAVESIARDITERKQVDEQLRHSQKMEALGLLAGGVVHEFHNLLMVISGHCEMILIDEAPAESIRRQLDSVLRAGNSAATLTKQLLSFCRRQPAAPAVLDPNVAIGNCSAMLRSLIGSDIELSISLGTSVGFVKVDAGQIEQVLINLVLNARDAMPQGGRLEISTERASLDTAPDGEPFAAEPAPYVVLAVSDTGIGMDEATQARIFEPFFSTKAKGKGTGLGLSIVYGIVQQSNGATRVQSKPGSGTTFRIYFPCVQQAQAGVEAEPAGPYVLTGTEKILVAEDDEPVRQLICSVLRKAGYQVVHAGDGRKALEIFRHEGDGIRLVLTDVAMPQIDGPALVRELRRQRPSLRAIYMTGYPGDTLGEYDSLTSQIPLIEKPFPSTFLLRKVREVLDSDVGSTAAMAGL
ncbi:MAG TPA: response regulator [Bryobacteraceae bacterium]|nr:response regulator [Bryobacteraceae bacterium]